jgi:hypothetical protein
MPDDTSVSVVLNISARDQASAQISALTDQLERAAKAEQQLLNQARSGSSSQGRAPETFDRMRHLYNSPTYEPRQSASVAGGATAAGQAGQAAVSIAGILALPKMIADEIGRVMSRIPGVSHVVGAVSYANKQYGSFLENRYGHAVGKAVHYGGGVVNAAAMAMGAPFVPGGDFLAGLPLMAAAEGGRLIGKVANRFAPGLAEDARNAPHDFVEGLRDAGSQAKKFLFGSGRPLKSRRATFAERPQGFEDALRQAEDDIRGMPHEVAAVFDDFGNEIGRWSQKDPKQVSAPDDALRGRHLTHNHPNEIDAIPSLEDLTSGVRKGLKSVRAVGSRSGFEVDYKGQYPSQQEIQKVLFGKLAKQQGLQPWEIGEKEFGYAYAPEAEQAARSTAEHFGWDYKRFGSVGKISNLTGPAPGDFREGSYRGGGSLDSDIARKMSGTHVVNPNAIDLGGSVTGPPGPDTSAYRGSAYLGRVGHGGGGWGGLEDFLDFGWDNQPAMATFKRRGGEALSLNGQRNLPLGGRGGSGGDGASLMPSGFVGSGGGPVHVWVDNPHIPVIVLGGSSGGGGSGGIAGGRSSGGGGYTWEQWASEQPMSGTSAKTAPSSALVGMAGKAAGAVGVGYAALIGGSDFRRPARLCLSTR